MSYYKQARHINKHNIKLRQWENQSEGVQRMYSEVHVLGEGGGTKVKVC